MIRASFFSLLFSLLISYSALAAESENSYQLRIPEGTTVTGVFQEGRSLQDEYDLLSIIYFQSGVHKIPLTPGHYPLSLIQRFEFGPDRKIAQSQDSGAVTVEIAEGNPVSANIHFEQNFELDGTTVALSIDNLGCNLTDGKPENEELVFDEPFLSRDLYMLGKIRTEYQYIFLKFASPSYESLPLYRLDLTLEGGQSIQLYQRWQPALAGTGPAKLVLALAHLQEGNAIQTSYWRLIYSAEHHNWNEKFWALFDAPLGEAFGVAVLTEDYPSRAEVYTLDQNFEPLRPIEVLSVEKKLYTGSFPPDLPNASIDFWEAY
jgi:hypothetical protein